MPKNCVCVLPYSVTVQGYGTFSKQYYTENVKCLYKKSLSLKKYFEKKNSQSFCCLYVNLSTVTIWEQSDKFPVSFISLQCLLQEKNFDSRK